MSNNIPIDKERGLDPHMCVCVNCGKNTGLTIGVILKAKDAEGNTHYCNRGETTKYNKSLTKAGIDKVTGWETITDSWEKVPIGFCEKCAKVMELLYHEAKNGGVMFKCSECNIEGVFKANSEAALEIRKNCNKTKKEVIGITLDKCEYHTVESELNDSIYNKEDEDSNPKATIH